MLSSDVAKTPRPRPPSKNRRSTSQSRDWRSPPPYAPFAPTLDTLPTLLGSPIAATSQLIHLDEQHEDNLQEKSKEELEELLKRASSMIKEREQELDMTSETCRTLAENNAALKARNDALISRIPPSCPSSPLVSPSLGSRLLLSPSHSRAGSASLLSSPKPGTGRRRPGHSRRISTTPAELAVLADQNAELLAKLADLESEATRDEQVGKRRLRALESEIEALRDDLERAREESERLEETLHSAPQETLSSLPAGLDKQVVKMFKKLCREAKVRELKAKARPWEQQGEKPEEPKDFAPNNLAPGLPFSSRWVARNKSTPALHIDTSHNASFRSDGIAVNTAVESPVPSLPPSATSIIGPTSREQALVSQLLLKIRELEETNTQLATDHLRASIRLKAVQTESESVRRLCEFISDEVEGDIDVELEVINDDEEDDDLRDEKHDNDPSALETSPRMTMRLRSVGRKTSLDLGSGATRRSVRLRKFRSMDSLPSSESLTSAPINHPIGERHPKTRKTILGLFEDSSSFTSPPLSSTPVHQSGHDAPLDAQPSFSYELSEGGENQQGSNTTGSKMPSLGSELGLQLDGLRPAPGHARSDSIMELLNEAGAATPRSPLTPSHSASQFSAENLGPLGSVPRLRQKEEGGARYPMGERIMYPHLRKTRSSAVFGSPSSSASGLVERQTEGYMQTASSPPLVDVVRFPSASLLSSPSRALLPITGKKQSDSQPVSQSDEHQQKTKQDRVTALLFELWLWMHFALAIAVFLFTIARLGPKTVLNKRSVTASAKKGN